MKRKLLFWLAMALSLMMRAQTEPSVTYSDCLDESMYDTVYYHSLSKDKIVIDGYLNSWGADRQTEVIISKLGSDLYITMIMEKSGGSDICHRRFKIIVDGCTGNEYRLHYFGKKGNDSLVTLTRYIPAPSANVWCDTSSGFINYTTYDNQIPLHFYASQNAMTEITASVTTKDTTKITYGLPSNYKKYMVPTKLTTIVKDTARVWVEEQDKLYRLGRNEFAAGEIDSSKKIAYTRIVLFDTIRLKGISSRKVGNIFADSVTLAGEHVPNMSKQIASGSDWIEKTELINKMLVLTVIGKWYDVELAGSRNGTTYWIACNEYGFKSDTTKAYGNARAMSMYPAYSPAITYTVKELGIRYPLLSVKNCACKMPKDLTVTSERFNNQACKGMKLLLKTNKQDSAMFDFSWQNNIYISTACVGCPQVPERYVVSLAENKDQDTITMPWEGENSGSLFRPAYLTVKPHNCPDREFEKSITFQFSTSSDTLPSPPKVKDTSINRNTTAKITALGKSLKWYNDLKSTLPTAKDTLSVSTATPGTQTLYVTQTNGTCESEPAKMMVTVVDKLSVAYSQNAEECNDNKANYSILYLKNAVQIEGFTRTNSCFIPKTSVVTSVNGDITTIHITKTDTVSDLCKCTSLRRFKVYVPGSFNKVRFVIDNYYNDALDTTVSKSLFTSKTLPWCDAVSKNVPFYFNATKINSAASLGGYKAYKTQNSILPISDKAITIIQNSIPRTINSGTTIILSNNLFAEQNISDIQFGILSDSLSSSTNDTTTVWVEPTMVNYQTTNKSIAKTIKTKDSIIDFIKLTAYNKIQISNINLNNYSYNTITIYADTTIDNIHKPNLNQIVFKKVSGVSPCQIPPCPYTQIINPSIILNGNITGTNYWLSSDRKIFNVNDSIQTIAPDNSFELIPNTAFSGTIDYRRIASFDRIKLSAVKDCQKCNAKPDSVTLTLKDKSINIICKPKAYCLKSNAQKNDFVYNWEFDSKTSSYNSSFQKDSSFERSAKIDSVILSNKDGKENYQIIALTVKSATCNNSEYARSANYMVSYSKDTLPNPPMVSDKTITQNAGEYVSVTAEGKNLRWYEKLGTSNFIADDTISVSATQIITKTYFVTQTNGTCESEPAKMTVTVVAKNDSVVTTKGKDYELEYGKKAGACGTSKDKLSYIYGDNSLTIQGYVITNSCAIPQTDVAISKVGNLSTVHITQKDTASQQCNCFSLRWFKLQLNGNFDTTHIIKDLFYSAAIDTTIARIGLPAAPQVTNIFVELGKTAQLAVNDSVQNKGTVNWFADQAMQTQLGTGNTYQFTPTQLGLQWLFCNRKSIIGISASTAVRVVVYAKNKDSILIEPSSIATYNGFTYNLQHDTLLVEGLIASCSSNAPRLIVRQNDTALSIDQYHGQCADDQTVNYFKFIIRVPDCNKDLYHVHLKSTDGLMKENGANTVLTVIRAGALFGLDTRGVHNVDTAISIPLSASFEYAIYQESLVTKLRETNASIKQELSSYVYKNIPGPIDGIHIHRYKAVKTGIDTVEYQMSNSKTTFRLVIHVRDTLTSISGIATSNDAAFTQGTVEVFEQIGNRYVCMAQCHTSNTGAFTASKLNNATYLLLLIPDREAKQVLPTYYINANRWEDAFKIALVGRLENMHLPVLSFQPLENGFASIKGTIRFDSNLLIVSKTKSGSLASFPVYVMQNGTIVAYAMSDENGDFQINNLPQGVYQVSVEVPGCARMLQTITLETTATVNFAVSGNTISAQAEAQAPILAKCVPNPTHDKLSISGVDGFEFVTIASAAGTVLLHSNEVTEDVSSLSAGIYFAIISTKTETIRVPFVKQ